MKIFWKIFLSILSIVIAMYVVLGGTLMYASFKNSLNSEKDRVLSENKLLMLTLKNTIEANISDEGSTQTYIIESVKSLEKNMGNEKFQIILYDEKNKKIYGSNGIKTAVNRERLTENKGAYVIDNVSGKHCLEAVYVIEVDSQRYYVSIVKDIEFVYEQRENMKWQYMGIFFAQLIVSAILSYFTAKRMAQPLAKLTRTTKNMAMGNYSIRADVKDGGEIGILTKNFNAMADNLEDKIIQLEDAAREKEDFTASFAHELKTPLTAIVGYSDMLRSMELEKKDIVEYSNYIFMQGKRLEKLSYSMMDLISMDKQNIDFYEIHMAVLMKTVKNMMAPLLKKKGIIYKSTIEDAKINANQELLISLFTNIIDNSRKAVTGDGIVMVEGKRRGNTYSVSIRDNGCGMEQSELKKITEAFYMIDKSRARKEGGAGIGMALCEKIVAIHNATWKINSELGKGTEIIVTFQCKEN
ncbi:MAG: HAMP domain-containing histidine kinase [Eubacterium sp.]|nr:HAMP domain-containing histidine kinase [Eubacterium sp.]